MQTARKARVGEGGVAEVISTGKIERKRFWRIERGIIPLDAEKGYHRLLLYLYFCVLVLSESLLATVLSGFFCLLDPREEEENAALNYNIEEMASFLIRMVFG